MSAAAAAGLWHRLGEAFGLMLIAGGVALAASLLSYHNSDPSWNTAAASGGSAVANWLGLPGAYCADVLVQAFGLAAYLLVVALVVWGWRLVIDRGLPAPLLRVTLVASGLWAAAVAVAALPVLGHGWPVGLQAGGSLGTLLLNSLRGVSFGLLDSYLIGLGATVTAVVLISVGLGVSFAVWLILWRLLFRLAVGLVRQGIVLVRRARRGKAGAGAGPVAGSGAGAGTGGAARVAGPAAAATHAPAPWPAGRVSGGIAALWARIAAFADEGGPGTAGAPGTRRLAPSLSTDGGPERPERPEAPLRPVRLPGAPAAGGAEAGYRAATGAVAGAAAVAVPSGSSGAGMRAAAGGTGIGLPAAAGAGAGAGAVVARDVQDDDADSDHDHDPYLDADDDAYDDACEDDDDRDHHPGAGRAGAGADASAGGVARGPTIMPAPRPLAPSRPGSGRLIPVPPIEDRAYQLPPNDLLKDPRLAPGKTEVDPNQLRENAMALEGVLADFGVRGTIQAVHPGPVVTLYELEPAPGTKSSRVIGLADDIARSMSAVSVRVAVIPGRNVIGIELPNARRETVFLRELLAAPAFERSNAKLALVLGKDIGGAPIIADLARFPHLLIAGTTGSGKSVAVNVMILSLLFRLPPDRCRFIMIDPKMLELSVYEGIPHLLSPVVTDPKTAVVALKWTVREMENRYRAMSKLGVRNIEGFNARLREARDKGEALTRRVQIGFDPDTGKPLFEEQPMDLHELPYIVVIVDEMADLMMVAGKDIEAAIQRLAQMARAAGIHLIMATQRPSVDVVTGTIKANFPTRISFQVSSKIDSRTILGEQGAEQLLGQGDMLFMPGGGRLVRVHGPFVSDDEVEGVVQFLKSQGEPDYDEGVTIDPDDEGGGGSAGAGGGGGAAGGAAGDDMYDRAVAVVVARDGKASTSYIQRQLRIGYNSAARLIERMEREGVVSKPNHAGKREVLAREGGGE